MKGLLLMLAALAPCSALCRATPGDAAARSGHYEAAAKLYRKEAEHDAEAARKLAQLFYYRPGLAEDRQEALTWYRRAFEMGDIRSAWDIGTIYAEGKGNVPRDLNEARSWFEKAANAGHHYGMYALANLHADGAVSPAGDVQGLSWLYAVTRLAELVPKKNEGHKFVLNDPKRVRTRLESRMTPPQIADARQRADAWVQQYLAKQR
jgi:uncharacterized protein